MHRPIVAIFDVLFSCADFSDEELPVTVAVAISFISIEQVGAAASLLI